MYVTQSTNACDDRSPGHIPKDVLAWRMGVTRETARSLGKLLLFASLHGPPWVNRSDSSKFLCRCYCEPEHFRHALPMRTDWLHTTPWVGCSHHSQMRDWGMGKKPANGGTWLKRYTTWSQSLFQTTNLHAGYSTRMRRKSPVTHEERGPKKKYWGFLKQENMHNFKLKDASL